MPAPDLTRRQVSMNVHRDERASRRGRPRARPGALLALSAAAIVIAACSSAGSGGRHVASLPGHPAAKTGTHQLTQAQSDQDMVDFARCLRSHGVNEPDPVHRTGHAGLSIEIPSPTAANRPAIAACDHFIQPIVSMKQAAAAAAAAPELAALTRYAQCMRAHDIDMLDPTPYGALNLGNVPGITSDFGRYSPQFRAADEACRHLLPAGVRDNGTGP